MKAMQLFWSRMVLLSVMSESGFDIQKELKKLPAKPGVYIMHGSKDQILYIGKAISLKNRVRQYFQSPGSKSLKIRKMIEQIVRFEYIVVDSEVEALVLENNLIKEYLPRYNTLLKDDKTYPYIKVTMGEDFPRVMLTRRVHRDKSRYFGPYTLASAASDTAELLRKLFKLRSCTRKLPQDIAKKRPCLYYHIHECLGPCNGYISKEDYRKQIDKALDFLSGKYGYVRNYLKEKMKESSDLLDFEKAIEYRKLLSDIESLSESQKVSTVDTEDRDVVGISIKESLACVQVFFIRDGRMIGRDIFHLDTEEGVELADVIYAFITQYYFGTFNIPREIWIQQETSDKELLENWLGGIRGGTVKILVPKRGNKEKLVEMAVKNAENKLNLDYEKLKSEKEKTFGAQEELRKILGLEKLERIESYDISNLNGIESVGSMVVFRNGEPRNNDYRKFKIRTVEGPNDYASLEEVILRRFTHDPNGKGLGASYDSFMVLPDLILMDGGKGQVNAALKVLKSISMEIPVCGMVKDEHHQTRGLYFNNNELSLDTHGATFKLITRIQDETHRFAIEYHRSLRSKAQVHSVLDDIPGIGDKRRRNLMRQFKDIDSIKKADIDSLKSCESMDSRAAKSVYDFFHKKNVGSNMLR